MKNFFAIRFLLLCALLGLGLSNRAVAPTVVSVTPANGATQVSATTTLVFKFDQDMDTSVALFPPTGGLAGTYDVTAPGATITAFGTWTDERTLTIEAFPQFPQGIITWKLNPPGQFVLFRLTSEGGEELAQLSGTFTTGVGGTDPHLGITIPANNATGVRTNVQVEFRFDAAMKKIANFSGTPGPIVWTGVGIDATRFTYSWSTDGRSLFANYTGGFPINTMVMWMLQPAGAAVKFESEAGGKFLATNTYTGSFFTSNGESCDVGGLPQGWGQYSIAKNFNYRQVSAADPVGDTESAAFAFMALISNPTGAGALTSPSVTKPNATVLPLQVLGGFGQFLQSEDDATALDTAFPAGTYVLRFTQTGQPERVINMTMPTSAGHPVPKIANFAAAQAINPSANFTLQWNAFSNPGANGFISMYIMDTNSQVIFQAPNFCVPRELHVTDTSIVIPAGTLRSNQTYNASISFGNGFYMSTNAIPQMSGYGSLVRNTSFTLKTLGSSVVGAAARLIESRLLPNGNPQFKITGTANASYGVERSGSLTVTNWQEIATVTMDVTGQALYEDTSTGKALPLYYRVLAK